MSIETMPRHDVLLLLELSEDASLQGLDTYLSRTLQLCADWFSASGASLFLKETKGEDFRLVAKAGADTRVPDDAKIVLGKGIAGAALAKGEPLLLQDRIESVLQSQSAHPRGQHIGSSMIVPLRSRQTGYLGVLCLSRRRGEPEFSEDDLSIARTLAGQIGLAVANARLFAETIAVQGELNEAKRLAEIGQMTAAIAHEIRNPLTGIRGAAQMVESLGEETAEFGRIIVEETDKLDRLCSEFLEFAKPLTLEKQPASLAGIAQQIVERETRDFEAAGVALTLEIVGEQPMIQIDARRIEQVCRNLLRNALQACTAGCQVVLRVKAAGFEVCDDGVGMDSEEIEKLFTPFFTTKSWGTGLGLSIVSKIVAAHEGKIEVISAKGKGSTMRILLEQVRGWE